MGDHILGDGHRLGVALGKPHPLGHHRLEHRGVDAGVEGLQPPRFGSLEDTAHEGWQQACAIGVQGGPDDLRVDLGGGQVLTVSLEALGARQGDDVEIADERSDPGLHPLIGGGGEQELHRVRPFQV